MVDARSDCSVTARAEERLNRLADYERAITGAASGGAGGASSGGFAGHLGGPGGSGALPAQARPLSSATSDGGMSTITRAEAKAQSRLERLNRLEEGLQTAPADGATAEKAQLDALLTDFVNTGGGPVS